MRKIYILDRKYITAHQNLMGIPISIFIGSSFGAITRQLESTITLALRPPGKFLLFFTLLCGKQSLSVFIMLNMIWRNLELQRWVQSCFQRLPELEYNPFLLMVDFCLDGEREIWWSQFRSDGRFKLTCNGTKRWANKNRYRDSHYILVCGLS